MKNNDVHKIVTGEMKVNNAREAFRTEQSYKPSVMCDRTLKSNLCHHSYKGCIGCETLGWCEYGKEAIRRFSGKD